MVFTLATIWRLALPYFRGEDRWPGRALLGAVIAIELSIVAINVALNWWNARFYNAVQDRDWHGFVHELLVFCLLAAAYIVLAVYQVYLNQWLRIRWRRWLTGRYLREWLDAANHYRMQLLGDAADNPDQRIAEDVQLFVDRTVAIGIGLLGAVVSLGSFVIILWALSEAAPVHLWGSDFSVPGYLVWAALLYAVIGTWLTHRIGYPLVELNFQQQRFEADFRFNLVRSRENSEQIALLNGEAAERRRLNERFAAIVGNFFAIMSRTKKLTFFTAGYSQASVIFPYVVVSPTYFAGGLPLGGLTQTASAFNSVQTALSFFINVYQQFAEWRAVIERLSGFDQAITAGRAAAKAAPVVRVESGGRAPQLDLQSLAVKLPQGLPLTAPTDIVLPAGEHVLLTGPSGAGKSTLFRVIGGIWPFGSGRVVIPEGARLMVLPQRPYLPIGSLEAAVCYPAAPGSCERRSVREVLIAVGLPSLADRLEEDGHWNRMLSVGEQQRLALARAVLHAPDYLLLDEATASLDEASEAALYRLIHERLGHATVISIGHRSTLRAFHRRHLRLAREGAYARLHEGELQPAE